MCATVTIGTATNRVPNADWHVALLIEVFATDLIVFTKLCLDELRSGKR